MAYPNWIIETFIDSTEEVDLSEATLARLIAVADTSEDVGLAKFDTRCWHRAVEDLAGQVRSTILNPGGSVSRVVAIENKTGRAVVFDSALNEWWPKIQCEMAKLGKPNFQRLRALLAQEKAKAVGKFPRERKSLENCHRHLVRCLNGIESLLHLTTQAAEVLAKESAVVADKTLADKPQGVAPRRVLKQPKPEAIAAYRLWSLCGWPQQRIADQLTENFKRPFDQGSVSRMLRQAKEFLEAGGVLPPVSEVKSVESVDPKVIDMGARQDHQTPRQRFHPMTDE